MRCLVQGKRRLCLFGAAPVATKLSGCLVAPNPEERASQRADEDILGSEALINTKLF